MPAGRRPADDAAGALALLVVADGSAGSWDEAADCAERALFRFAPQDDAASRAAAAVARVAGVLAPLGGAGSYGAITDAVRSVAHGALFRVEPHDRDASPHTWTSQSELAPF